MSWLFVLLNIAATMVIGTMSSIDSNPSRVYQIKNPVITHTEDKLVRNQNVMSFVNSRSLLFLHLLKHKMQYQKLEKISTTTPLSRDCICVPFYLCDNNQTIITDGIGVIDVRIRRCTGDLEVCCYPPNIMGSTAPIVTPRPTIPPMTFPTAIPTLPPTIPSVTLPPVVFPTGFPIPPATGFPNLNCICVNISLCDPSGIVTNSGEGIINPRQQYGLCSNTNQVCCRILATTTPQPTNPPTSMTPASTMTVPSGQTQVCFMCGNLIQCITCEIITVPGSGVIDPRFYLTQGAVCSGTNSPLCQGATTSSPSINLSAISNLLGQLKNPGTPQACYCVKSWLCSEGNVTNLDGLGIIDPRFTACQSADEVCCRLMGIDFQSLRNSVTSTALRRTYVANDTSDPSLTQVACGIQDNSYALSQPFPANSGKTYFAEFPWMVALLVKSASDPHTFQCGATMISNRAILTAAHCVINKKPENLVARFGQWDIRNDTQPLPTQEVNIFAIASHPSYYSGGLFHDIAILILEKPVVYSANILPICLPEQGTIFAPGIRCYGTGWGSNTFDSEGEYQAELRKVDIPIVDRADCQTRLQSTKLGQNFQLHGSFICAGGEANRDTCRGDGGGPLVCQAITGQFFQAGIVSWGIGCGISNVPAVYVSVSQHRQWIDQQLATYGVQ